MGAPCVVFVLAPFWGAGVVPMAPQRPGDHFDHVKTPNGAVSTRFRSFLMFSAIFLYQHNTSLSLSFSLSQTDTMSLCGTQTMSLWHTDSPSVAQRQSLCPTETVSLSHRDSVSLWKTRSGLRAAGGRRRRAVAPTPTPLVSTHTHPKSLSRAAGDTMP